MEVLKPAYQWPRFKMFTFRFFFIYFLIYCFPFPFDSIELIEPIVQPYFRFLDLVIKNIGSGILNLPVQVAYPGFDKVDDSYYGITFLIVNLFLSLTGTIIWSFLDRNRSDYSRLHVWLRLYLRYFLAAYLLGYGFAKFFPSQFQEVTASRLIMEVGEQSPMLLAWNFMGYSVAFTRASGIIEIIAGLLLFYQRTATLGALLSTMTFGFVALLDYCFNVPIKLFVSHLLIISIFLLLNDGKRLLSVFVLNKPVESVSYTPLFRNKRWSRRFAFVLALCTIGIIYKACSDSIEAAEKWGRYAPRVPLYGIYETTLFIRNRDTIPPLQTDTLRWKQLVIDGGSWKQSGLIKFSNDRKNFYSIETDTVQHTMRIRHLTDTLITYNFHFTQTGTNHLILEGKWKEDSVRIFLTKTNLDSIALFRDRFRFVSD